MREVTVFTPKPLCLPGYFRRNKKNTKSRKSDLGWAQPLLVTRGLDWRWGTIINGPLKGRNSSSRSFSPTPKASEQFPWRNLLHVATIAVETSFSMYILSCSSHSEHPHIIGARWWLAGWRLSAHRRSDSECILWLSLNNKYFFNSQLNYHFLFLQQNNSQRYRLQFCLKSFCDFWCESRRWPGKSEKPAESDSMWRSLGR